MSKKNRDLYGLFDNDEYDLINIVNIDSEISQEGFDLQGIVSYKKKLSEMNLIAVKDHNVAIMIFSKKLIGKIRNISKYIRENSFYNKKLSLHYLNSYLKDSDKKKNLNIFQYDEGNIKLDTKILPKKIQQEYGYEIMSLITTKIKSKIEVINTYKVRRKSIHRESYIEGLLKTNDNILINFNNRTTSLNIDDRLNFYKSKLLRIPDLAGKVKISGYAVAGIVRQLMNAFNSDAVNSNSTFIRSNFYGKKIFPSYIEIIDCPNSIQFFHKNLIDHNGLLTRKKYIIKKGRIFNFFGEVNSCLRNGLADSGNYYKKTSDLANGLITYKNIILKVNKFSKKSDYSYEIKEFSLDSFLNLQTGQFSGNCYGYKMEVENITPVVCNVVIDIVKFFNEILSISENKLYDDVICPDIVVEFKENTDDKN